MIELTFSTSPWFLLLCVAAAAGGAWWLYRTAPAGTPAWLIWVLRGMRATTLFLLALLLLEPLWSALRPEEKPPRVVLLQDVSLSLPAQMDSSWLKRDYPKAVTTLKERLESQGAAVSVLTFGREPGAEETLPDSFVYDAVGSNPASALEALQQRFGGDHLVGVVLATDGIPTEGTSPLYAATGLRVPVYSVLVGDTTPRKDVAIEGLLHNEVGYRGNKTEVQVTLAQQGFQDRMVTVRLWDGNELLGTRQVRLPDMVTFPFPMQEAGLQVYRVTVSPLEGELTLKNNVRTFAIQVLDNRQKVLLLAGGPHPDLGALEATLTRSDRFELLSRVHVNAQGFFQAPKPSDLTEADLVILHNFPASTVDKRLLGQVFEQVERRGLPLLHIVGSQTRLDIDERQRQYMALFASKLERTTQEVLLRLTPAFKRHATFTFDEGFDTWLAGAPPLLRPAGDWAPQRGSEVFATAMIKGIALDYPVLAIEQTEGRKNLVVLGENLWRLRVQDYVDHDNFEYFDTWLQNVVQWLTVKEDRRRFRVRPTQALFEGDSPVRFKGEVYDESYNPMSGVEIKLMLTDSSGNEDTHYLAEATRGSYATTLRGLPEGTYRYQAVGTQGGLEVGRDQGRFSVGQSNVEFTRLTADAELLRQIGLRTGGGFFLPDQFEALSDTISKRPGFAPLVSYGRRSIRLNELLWPLVVVLLLLSGEWVLRKRYGML